MRRQTIQIPRSKCTRVERLAVRLERLEQSLHAARRRRLCAARDRPASPRSQAVERSRHAEGRVVLLDFGLTSDVGGCRQSTRTRASWSARRSTCRPSRRRTVARAGERLVQRRRDALRGAHRATPVRGPTAPRDRAQAPRGSAVAAFDSRQTCRPTSTSCACDCLRAIRRSGPMARRSWLCSAAHRRPPTLQLAANKAPRFVGRRSASSMRSAQAFRDSREGRPVAAIVRGSSGMGKSALVRQFLDEVAIPSGAIVLEGRCYERESVPYKGLDSVIDALTIVPRGATPRAARRDAAARHPGARTAVPGAPTRFRRSPIRA